MSKNLSNVLKGNNNTVLPAVGNTGNVLTSTGNTWVSASLPIANTSTLGVVKFDGTTITANNGVISSIMAKTIKTISGSYTVLPSDNGKIILCSGTTYVVYLSAAATLGSGFSCYIYAATTSSIIIAPSNSEKLDNRTNGSYYMYGEGAGAEIVCDGTGFWLGARKLPMGMAFGAYSSGYSAATASGAAAFAYGGQASAAGIRSVAFGETCSASATGSYTFGDGSTASGQYSYALGYKASSLGLYSVAIGGLASANVSYSTAIGQNSSGGQASANAYGAIALSGSFAGGLDSFAAAIANNTSSLGATGANSIAIGRLAKASAANSVAIGSGSTGVGAVTSVAANGAIALGASYASGVDSFAAAITNNTNSYGATGDNSIAIGVNTIASSQKCMAIGPYAQATGFWSIAIGASSSDPTTASGAYAVAIGSNFATASGAGSIALGNFSKAQQDGKFAFSSRNFFNANANEAQFGMIVLGNSTTTSTPVVLVSWNTNVTTTNQLVVASDQAMTFFGTLIAKQATSANMASYIINGAIVNNAGTVSISSISIDTIVDTIGLTTQPTFTVDATNKALAVTSGAKATTNIRWVCTLQTAEVTYA